MADDEASSSDNESVDKEKSASKKQSEDYDADAAAAAPLTPTPEKPKKSGGGIAPKITAIVALILTIIAVALSAVLTTYWWDWPWAVTTPALALSLTALILAFLKFDSAALTAGVVGVILAIGAIVWCALELSWCSSYQGKLDMEWTAEALKKAMKNDFVEFETYGDKKVFKAKWFYEAETADKGGSKSTYNPYMCSGRTFDWSYRKEAIILKHDCGVETAKALYNKEKEVKESTSEKARYDGVDSYEDSPIYQTHADISDRNEMFYTVPAKNRSTIKEALDKFCTKNFKVEAFLEARKKCDAALEKQFKPKCSVKYKTYAFSVGTMEELEKLEACRLKKEGEMSQELYSRSKFVLAMADEPSGAGGPGGPGGAIKVKFVLRLAAIAKLAKEAAEQTKKLVKENEGTDAEAEEWAKKASEHVEKEDNEDLLAEDVAALFLGKFESQRDRAKAADKLSGLLPDATPGELAKLKDELINGGDSGSPEEIAERVAKAFRKEKIIKAAEIKVSKLLKEEKASPKEIENYIKYFKEKFNLGIWTITNPFDPAKTEKIANVTAEITKSIVSVFRVYKMAEALMKEKDANSKEIKRYTKRETIQKRIEKAKRDDPKKTDDEIAKQIAADIVAEFEVYKKVKEQLEEKGATPKEIKDNTVQGDIRGQLDRAKRQNSKKTADEIADEVIKDIVSEFEVDKKKKDAREKAKQLLKEKGNTPEQIKAFIESTYVDGRSKKTVDEMAKDIVSEFEKKKAVVDEVKKQLTKKGATTEQIDDLTRDINGRSDETVDEMAKDIVSKFEKKKAVVDEVEKLLIKKSATPEQKKECTERVWQQWFRDDQTPKKAAKRIVRQCGLGDGMGEGPGEGPDEGPGEGPGKGPGRPGGIGEAPGEMGMGIIDQIKPSGTISSKIPN